MYGWQAHFSHVWIGLEYLCGGVAALRLKLFVYLKTIRKRKQPNLQNL